MDKLQDEQIEARLSDHPEWSMTGETIQRTYGFDDFVSAVGFVNQVASHAEVVQHHPDILIRYSKVTLTLSTHDAGGLTDKDFAFASMADGLIGAPVSG